MARTTKAQAKDRRAVVEELRREQARAEKKRSYAIFAACAVVALVIIGLGAYPLIRDARQQGELAGKSLDSLGVSVADAGCQKVTTAPATGSAQHVPEGQELSYPEAPPASGEHFPLAAAMERKFYTAGDRPDLGYLVHNLEHGYTILWYDETIADDSSLLAEVKAIAGKFPGTSDPRNKFIAAPWTADDGADFPDDAHLALTHWSVGQGSENAGEAGQVGVWQYCSAPSGAAVADFVEKYPYTDSPEPNAA